jgi:hypothetical protein
MACYARGPLSAHLPPCHPSRRRSLHLTDSGNSGLAAGTGLHAPKQTSVIAMAIGEVG